MNISAKEFKLFANRLVAKAMKLCENLHVRMDDMEERVNNKLREILILDLARFTAELK